MSNPIFLLRSSPHNEDFLLSGGYATNEEEIKAVARKYVVDLFFNGGVWLTPPPIEVTVDYNAKLVIAKWTDEDGDVQDKTYHLSTIEKVK